MEPYLGQIITVAFNFAPPGWLPCDGRALPIAQNEVLFALLGTRYGGDGVKTFNIPHYPETLPAPNDTKHVFYLIATQGIYPSQS